jgi:hypothetical protein
MPEICVISTSTEWARIMPYLPTTRRSVTTYSAVFKKMMPWIRPRIAARNTRKDMKSITFAPALVCPVGPSAMEPPIPSPTTPMTSQILVRCKAAIFEGRPRYWTSSPGCKYFSTYVDTVLRCAGDQRIHPADSKQQCRPSVCGRGSNDIGNLATMLMVLIALLTDSDFLMDRAATVSYSTGELSASRV